MTAALEGGVSGQQHAPASLYPGKDPVPILQEAGWAPGPVWTGRKSRPPLVFDPDLPAHSQSLCWLSYPAHYIILHYIIWNRRLNLDLQKQQNFCSSWEIATWEPHGLALGALLCNVYINDFPLQINSLAVVVMFAANTSILVSHTNYMMLWKCLTLYCYASLTGSRPISWRV